MKANHARLQYGSGGTGTSSHIACVLLGQRIGVDVTHVPYRGGGPAFTDLIAGRLDYFCNYIRSPCRPPAAPGADAARSRARAPFAGDQRAAVPTAAEQGSRRRRRLHLERGVRPQGHAARGGGEAQRRGCRVRPTRPWCASGSPASVLDMPPPERRTPEFLARYVVDEMAKWAPAIMASGAGEE